MNIEDYIKNTDWKFADLLQLEKTSKRVANEIYNNTNHADMLQELWEETVPHQEDGISFGSLYLEMSMGVLTKKVMAAFQKHFESATVSFEGAKEETVKPPKPPSLPESINKKLTENKDGTNLPPGVERI